MHADRNNDKTEMCSVAQAPLAAIFGMSGGWVATIDARLKRSSKPLHVPTHTAPGSQYTLVSHPAPSIQQHILVPRLHNNKLTKTGAEHETNYTLFNLTEMCSVAQAP